MKCPLRSPVVAQIVSVNQPRWGWYGHCIKKLGL